MKGRNSSGLPLNVMLSDGLYNMAWINCKLASVDGPVTRGRDSLASPGGGGSALNIRKAGAPTFSVELVVGRGYVSRGIEYTVVDMIGVRVAADVMYVKEGGKVTPSPPQ